MAEVNKPVALIIDDEGAIGESLAGVLSDEGWHAEIAFSGSEGVKKFREVRPDLVLCDVWMAGMGGIEVLQKLKELDRQTPIVIMSGHATIDTAVRATKLGAFEFLEKPLSLDKLLPMLEHAAQIRDMTANSLSDGNVRQGLIGVSESIEKIRSQIEVVAPRNAWVLLTGENGTGKEVVARLIHTRSSRAKKPFVALNCAAIPEELIESELFGHAKGAFTNAIANKQGKFELAHRGTLFLDEIGDMSLKTQAKILRILQEREFERIGGAETRSVDVRVIAATNKDLKQEISRGRFREDLFYRLNVIPFHLPPLRERGGDVLLIAKHFLQESAKELKEPVKTLDAQVEHAFRAYSWPGNVRELSNTIERLCILVRDEIISLGDLPANLRGAQDSSQNTHDESLLNAGTLKEAKSEFEKNYIVGKLEEHCWNVSKTAEAIGIERSNLHRKLKTYEIDPKKLKG